MIKIKEMAENDFNYALRLTNLMKWDYSRKDFEWMVYFEPKGCFVAMDGNKRVGIITTITYQNLGWIGNAIVSPKYRHKGIGSKLVSHAIDYLKSKSVEFIGLYSYLETSRFYNKLGFKEDEQFIRLIGKGKFYSFEGCRRMASNDLKDIIEFDSKCFSVCRKKVLNKIFEEFKDLCWLTVLNKEIIGYIMGKKSATGMEVGPWICNPKHTKKAFNLLKAFLSNAKNMRISLVIPEKNLKLMNKLKELGFKIDFKVIRMFYNGIKPKIKENFILAIESLERG